MKRFIGIRALLRAVLMGFVLLPGWAFAAGTFEKLCIFGDSLSDTGNVFEVTHEVSTRPYALIPSAPYPIGGITFTNGDTWIQHIAESLGRSDDAKPALRGSGPFCNYAFGSGRARQREGQPYDLPGQVAGYLDDFGSADANTLYVIFVGSNDIRDALVAYPGGSEILAGAVGAIVQSILDLYGVGASKFLIMNAPNVKWVPAVSAEGPAAQFLAEVLSSGFNGALASALGSLELLPGIELMDFDVFSFTNDIAMTPPEGIVNTVDSCITPDVRAGAICADPDQYAFWDGIHPTKVIHSALAEAVAQGLPVVLASN